MATLTDAATKFQHFQDGSLTSRLWNIEKDLKGRNATDCTLLCSEGEINSSLLDAVLTIKRLAGQVNVVVHAVGILLLLPDILEPGEVVFSASLGTGSTEDRLISGRISA